MEGFTPNPNLGQTNPSPEKGGMGALIGSIIIIIILVFGGIYFWGQNVGDNINTDTATTTESVGDIEQSLNDQNLDTLDVDLNQGLNTEL